MVNFNNFTIKNLFISFGFISKINLKLLITLICLVFLSNSINGNFHELANQTIALKEILWLLSATIFTFLSIIINAYAWKCLIRNIGCNINKLDVIKIFINTNIYKYLPGGIWHFVSRYNMLRLNFTNERSVESVLLEPLLMLVAALIFIPFGSLNIFIFILCWSSTLVLVKDFRGFIISVLKGMKTSIFTRNYKFDDTTYIQNNKNILPKKSYPFQPLLVEIIFILFRFFGFMCCINAFSVRSLISNSELISYFSFAWIIGLIVPGAPGGMGVFESVILFVLGSQLPEAPLIASLLCYRLVATISDIFLAMIYPVKRLLRVSIMN